MTYKTQTTGPFSPLAVVGVVIVVAICLCWCLVVKRESRREESLVLGREARAVKVREAVNVFDMDMGYEWILL